jgi:hypothetical protein
MTPEYIVMRARQANRQALKALHWRTGTTGSARRLVQVYNAGSMANQGDHIFLTNPIDLDGAETEGGSASPLVDTSTSVPVVAIGTAPLAGDMLVATAVGGRWVVEKSGKPSAIGYPCRPCAIPESSLTLSWVNLLAGNGSTQLTYTSPGLWVSECTSQIAYQMRCTNGEIELRAIYFVSGSCPTGRSQYCSNLLSKPLYLYRNSQVCSPFYFTWNVTASSCPVLGSNGYTSFTVTE